MYSRKPAGWSIGLEGARWDSRRLDERLGQSDLPTKHEGPLEPVRVPVLISSSVPALVLVVPDNGDKVVHSCPFLFVSLRSFWYYRVI